MRIYISLDAEGCTGINCFAQVTPGTEQYRWGCERVLGDLNAAIEGAFQGGATEVLVCDAHDMGANIPLERMHKGMRLIRGTGGSQSMMQGLSGDFDAVFMVGYHARRGSLGVLAHTYFPKQVYEVKIDGRTVGEFGINAYYAGAYDLPVALVTGDDQLVSEARELVPELCAAVVKTSVSTACAECLPPEVTQAGIREAAALAINKAGNIQVLTQPSEIEVGFFNAGQAAYAAWVPGVVRIAPDRIKIKVEDYKYAFKMLMSCMFISLNHKS